MSKVFRKFPFFRSRDRTPAPATYRHDAVQSSSQATEAGQTTGLHDAYENSRNELQVMEPSATTFKQDIFDKDHSYGVRIVHTADNATLDIVFVHGLTGNSFSTWCDSTLAVHWPRDLLKEDLPFARVMSFGYDVDVASFRGHVAQDGLLGHAKDLLRDLERRRKDTANRSLIFVAHSLGGLVVQHAISYSRTTRHPHLRTVEASTIGLCFLGTPHHGADLARWGDVLAKLVGLTTKTNSAPIKLLRPESEMLRKVQDEFHNVLEQRKEEGKRIQITCFYETLPQSQVIIVPKESAIIKGELDYPLHTTHSGMTRFANREDPSYSTIVGELSRIMELQNDRVIGSQQGTSRSVKLANDIVNNSGDHPYGRFADQMQSLNDAAHSCLIRLGQSQTLDYQFELPKPVQGTCEWILQHPQYVTWASSQSSLLWITGDPGCGKTTLSQYLVEHLEAAHGHSTSVLVCSYFCNDYTDEHKDGRSILRSLIFQMLRCRRSLLTYFKDVFDMQGAAFAFSFPSLWSLFLTMVNDSDIETVHIILDAVDECESDTRDKLLKVVIDFFSNPEESDENLNRRVRLLMTSRPNLSGDYIFNGFARCLFRIEEYSQHLIADIRLMIDKKIRDLVEKSICPPESQQWLQDCLCSKADQTFLWVSLVLGNLERDEEECNSKKLLREAVLGVPIDLRQTYQRFLNEIPDKSQERAQKLLHILIGSARLLTIAEINIAFTIQPRHTSLNQLDTDLFSAPERRIRRILGPLIRISGDKVSLVHQSLRDFLLDTEVVDPPTTAARYAVQSKEVNLVLASACISYLQLEDFNQLGSFRRSGTHYSTTTESPTSITGLAPTASWDPMSLEFDNIFATQDDLTTTACEALMQQHVFLSYAAQHWTRHLRACLSIAPQHLIDSASTLLQQSSGHSMLWLEIFWLTCDMDVKCPRGLGFVTAAGLCGFDTILEPLLASSTGCLQEEKDAALFWAARMGFVTTVQMLLAYNANPNTKSLEHQTSLVVAAKYGHHQVIECLVENIRTDANISEWSGRTALSFAAGYGHFDIVQTMLTYAHIVPDLPDENLMTPLFWAVDGDHVDAAKALLDKTVDCNPNHRDRSGRTAASWAAGEGSVQSLKLLVRRVEVDLNMRDHSGRSPLSWAAGSGHASTVRVLLKSSRVLRKDVDKDGRTPISYACGRGSAETLKLLFDHGCAGIDEADQDGWTPLAWALDRGFIELVQVLITTGHVDVNHRDNLGRTPIFWAASYGQAEIVSYLLKSGADPTITDFDGIAAQDRAVMYHHVAVSDILEQVRHS